MANVDHVTAAQSRHRREPAERSKEPMLHDAPSRHGANVVESIESVLVCLVDIYAGCRQLGLSDCRLTFYRDHVHLRVVQHDIHRRMVRDCRIGSFVDYAEDRRVMQYAVGGDVQTRRIAVPDVVVEMGIAARRF
mgnify:CR=1 FL=1